MLAVLAGTGLAAAAQDKLDSGPQRANTGDVAIFCAIDKGFLKAEGIEANLLSFDTGAKMVPALATGELDIAPVPASAGTLQCRWRARPNNRIVADRSRSMPDDMYQTLMIRKDLVDSGRFKTYADLKGLKIAVAAPGISILSIVNEAAKKAGIPYDDIEKVFIPLPQQVTAFRNRAVDGSIMIEPFATLICSQWRRRAVRIDLRLQSRWPVHLYGLQREILEGTP